MIAAVAVALLIGAGGGAIAATAAQQVLAKTGTPGNSCYNPTLATDAKGYGPLGTGAAGIRKQITSHVVAQWAYQQPSSNGEDPSMFLPRQDVMPGQAWNFAMDSWVQGPDTREYGVMMAVDWYDTSGNYVGWDGGPTIPVPGSPSAEHWYRVSGDFTVPATATRANVTASLSGPAGMTWSATACEYRPAEPKPAADTAAARFGWGTPLPESDEFNYGSESAPVAPDPTKWWNAGGTDGCMPGNGQNGRRCEANTRVLGTFARMTGDADGDTGWIQSQRAQRYGRWEVRARSEATGPDNGHTYHPVLITWPVGPWPEGAEYDFLENGSPGENCAQANLHYPDHLPKVQEQAERCGVDLTQWHDYALEWTPQHLVGYIDGIQWFSYDQQCIQCAPDAMFQTIQLDNFNGTDQQPATFDIDWARVYAIAGVSLPPKA